MRASVAERGKKHGGIESNGMNELRCGRVGIYIILTFDLCDEVDAIGYAR